VKSPVFNRLLLTCRTLRQECKCYLCLLIGKIKVLLFFDQRAINKLEIGSAGSHKNGFISSDLSLQSNYPYDLRAGLPFPDNSIDFIYAEHVLEHFSYRDLHFLLLECSRVLKQHGALSVSVPNAEIYIRAYSEDGILDRSKFTTYSFGLPFLTNIDYINHIAYMDDQHKYLFDQDNLLQVLKAAGFQDVKKRDFDGSLDKESRRHMSLFAIARKEAHSSDKS